MSNNLTDILVQQFRKSFELSSVQAQLVQTAVFLGYFMAPMFPTIFASGVEGLGKATKLGGSIIVMSVIGGAVIPSVLGYVAHLYESYGAGYLVTAVCYAVVAVYAATFFHSKLCLRPSTTPFEQIYRALSWR